MTDGWEEVTGPEGRLINIGQRLLNLRAAKAEGLR